MNRVVKLIFVLMIILGAYNIVSSQMVTWQKWYDFNNFEDNGQDVLETVDGGYAILSNSYFPRKTGVIKTDQFGNVEWQKLYDINNVGENPICYTITQSKDSGYIISGGSGLIFKINKIGDVSWFKRFPGSSRISNHKITHNGGIIATGFSAGTGSYLVKTDSAGNIEWDNTYDSIHYVIKVIEDRNNLFYMLGLATTLTKINEVGKVIWKKNLALHPTDLLEHPSGNIFVGGGIDSMVLYKMDSSDSTIFQKSYYTAGINGCLSMCLSKGKNILMAGNDNFRSSMAVSKIKPDGNLIFNKAILTMESPAFCFLPYAVNSTSDSGFIFAGFTNYPPTFYESNIYVSKTDSQCNAPLMVGISHNNNSLPAEFSLSQNYPNPFNPVTNLEFGISKLGFVSLKVYDALGKEIKTLVNEMKSPGTYKVDFDGSGLSSGIYFYKLSTGDFTDTKRMILLK